MILNHFIERRKKLQYIFLDFDQSSRLPVDRVSLKIMCKNC